MNSEPGKSRLLDVAWLGRVDYQVAWDLQRALAAQRGAGQIADTLLLLEHPCTITMGRAADPAHVLWDAETLRAHGISLVAVDRGGDVTLHMPGQLVGYPILDLHSAPGGPDLHRYLRNLEEVLIQTLADFGVTAYRFAPHTGVWSNLPGGPPVKLTAIGVKASRWITLHGFALNVNNDLELFRSIIPCGIQEFGVGSMAGILGRSVDSAMVRARLVERFLEVFAFRAAQDAIIGLSEDTGND